MTVPSASFESLVHDGALLTVAGAALWGVLVLAAVLVEACSGGRFAAAPRLGCPARWHRWLRAAVTAVLAGTLLAPPATAEEHGAPAAPAVTGPLVLDGLALPDRPTGAAGSSATSNVRAREPPTVSGWVTVLPGDSLWAISRRLLPADAPATSIAALTRSLYTHNRTTVGADPDLIRPGQRLHVPPAPHETYSEDS